MHAAADDGECRRDTAVQTKTKTRLSDETRLRPTRHTRRAGTRASNRTTDDDGDTAHRCAPNHSGRGAGGRGLRPGGAWRGEGQAPLTDCCRWFATMHGISVRFGSLYKPCQLSARHHHHAQGEWDTCTFSVHAVRCAVAGHAVRCAHRCRLLSDGSKNGSNYWRSSSDAER